MIKNTLAVFVSLFAWVSIAQAQSVPVYLDSTDDIDPCAWGKVTGLKVNGDGFLAVRTGPGTNYKMIDKIHNGQEVYLCDWDGKWIGVLYTKKNTDCFSRHVHGTRQKYNGRCWNGWVHRNWVELLAG